jgi:hypothetical protein
MTPEHARSNLFGFPELAHSECLALGQLPKVGMGRDCLGLRCLIEDEPARVKDGGEVAMLEPVSLDADPIFVPWEEIAERFDQEEMPVFVRPQDGVRFDVEGKR